MEIDLKYQNGKIFKRNNNNYLPFIIDRIPSPLSKEHMLEMTSDKSYLQYDSKKIDNREISNKDSVLQSCKFYLLLALLFSVLTPIFLLLFEEGSVSIFFYIVFITIGVLFLIPAYFKWKKSSRLPERISVIFDRYDSTITLPALSQLDHFKIPFNHLKAARIKLGFSAYQITNKPQLIFYTEPNIRTFDDGYIDMTMYGCHNDAQETWSYYVWYMDKYRPLPPRHAFDPYRQQDFERRKAEGFPAPLYKSVVPTPEATPEQQLEREKFWKDEDYTVDASEAKFSLLAGAFSEKKRNKMKEKNRRKMKKKANKKGNGNQE